MTAPPIRTGEPRRVWRWHCRAKFAGQRGFTYIAILFAVALVGLGLAALGTYWSAEVQRERERDLVFIGDQMAVALWRYYENSPNKSAKEYPQKIEDLLEDRRNLVNARHLRRFYADPLTGSRDWGLVRTGGRITGIYSLSTGVPMVKAGFPPGYEKFAAAKTHGDWVFYPRDPRVKGGGENSPAGAPAAAGESNALPAVTSTSAGADSTTAAETPTSSEPAAAPRSSAETACSGQRFADYASCAQLDQSLRARCMTTAGLRYGECLRNGSAKRPLDTGG